MYVTPYLFLDGNCTEALDFYKKALGAEIEMLSKYGDSPAKAHVAESLHDKVIHARLRIGNTVILFSDSHVEGEGRPHGYSMTLHVDEAAMAERMFAALAEGGSVAMKMDKTFFAERYGQLTDRFGIPWMIICEKPL